MSGSGNIRGKYSVEREPQDKKLFHRWGELAFVLGTFFIALGVALMEKGGLGMSMVTSQSNINSLAVPFLTFGMADYMLQGLLLIGYYIIVRRFDWKNILSFFSAFIFGVVLDGIMWVLRDLQAASLIQRILFFAAGMLTNSLGVAFFFQTYLPLQVYELFVTGIVERFGWKLHRVKSCFDMCCCLSYRSYRVRVICTCINRTVTDVAVLFFVCIYSFCNSFFLFKNVMVLPAI